MGTIAEMFERQGYEKAIHEKDKWVGETKIETTQQLILENLTERFGVVSQGLSDRIKSIHSLDTLNALFKQTHRVNSLEEFKALVDKALES